MNKNSSLEEYIAKLENQRMKKQVFEQLLKDFSRAQIELNVDITSSTKEWIQELTMVLGELFNRDTIKLYQLFYLIDLPEEYYQGVKEMESIDYGLFFTQLVLMRTLKKIAYRNQYS